jgi:hypothetical protein
MRRVYLILFIVLFSVSGCKKDKTTNSGTVTINNELSGSGPYYAMGFSVKTGTKVSTLEGPLDVITILGATDINMEVRKFLFSCENFENSFWKYGDYNDATSAKTAFDNIKTFSAATWTATGDSVVPNQIWLFRTSDTRYAKLRVISTFTEKRTGMPFPYCEAMFEWVYQPDGTQIFP